MCLLNLAQDYRNETYEAHAHELGTFQGHKRALKSTREKRGRASKANPERTQKTPFVPCHQPASADAPRLQFIMAHAGNTFISNACNFCCGSRSLR